MICDPEEWEKKNECFEPVYGVAPLELCDGLKIAALAIHAFWSSYDQIRVRSEHPILPAEMTRVPAAAARNINVVVDAQFNQTAGK